MIKVRHLPIVEVEVPEKKSSDRTAKLSRLMQRASNFGAKIKYVQDDEECAKIGFESDNPDALCIMLNN